MTDGYCLKYKRKKNLQNKYKGNNIIKNWEMELNIFLKNERKGTQMDEICLKSMFNIFSH